nr:efflux RND transporter permease subunit [Desulforhabdus amnigena]
MPNEDQGYLMGLVVMPDAASLKRTVLTSSLVDALFARNPAVANRTAINGYSLIDGQYKPNVATFFVTLKDFKERYSSIERARKENARAA